MEKAGLMDDDGRRLRDTLRARFDEILAREEIYWRQRLRGKWIKEGDRNTVYFQRIAYGRRKVNTITSITVGGLSFSSNEDIRRQVRDFYSRLFIEDDYCRPRIVDDLLACLFPEKRGTIFGSFSEEEVYQTVFSLARDRGPRPDSFLLAFFQRLGGYQK